jgi:MFS family permease
VVAIKWHFCFVQTLTTTGFDGTVMSSVNSMTQYQTFFGLDSNDTSGTGIVFGMNTLGGVVAFFPAAYLPDKVGRRWTMFIGNVILIIGALVNAFATNLGMFIGGRFLVGFGGGIANNAS